MAQIISATFDDPAQAQQAAQTLSARYGSAGIRSVAPKAGGTAKALTATLMTDGLTEVAAAYLASAIKAGRAYVGVRAGWGNGRRITEILRAHGALSIDSNTPAGEETPTVPNTFPLSAALNWTLLSDDATPLSRYWNLPLLANDFSLSAKFGLSTTGNGKTPLSSALGLKLLTDTPTPLSSAFGLKVLSDSATPLSTAFKWPVLSTRNFFFPTRPNS
jgi:hypothetical protein